MLHPPTKFSRKLLRSFCVILQTDQQRIRWRDMRHWNADGVFTMVLISSLAEAITTTMHHHAYLDDCRCRKLRAAGHCGWTEYSVWHWASPTHFHTIIDLSVPDLGKDMNHLSGWQTTCLMDHVIQEKHQKLLMCCSWDKLLPFSVVSIIVPPKMMQTSPFPAFSCFTSCQSLAVNPFSHVVWHPEVAVMRNSCLGAISVPLSEKVTPDRPLPADAHTQRCEVERAASYSPHPLT